MFLDFSPLLDTMMAPHRQTKRPVHAQRRSSFDLGELPEHLQALVLGSPQLGLAELCAAASASKGLQALVQEQLAVKASITEKDFPKLVQLQAWLLRSSISRVPIVNLSPVLGRLHNYLGIALNSAGKQVHAVRRVSLCLPNSCVQQRATSQHEHNFQAVEASDGEARSWLQGDSDPPELPVALEDVQVPQAGNGGLGQVVMAAGHDLECLELRNVPTSWVGLDLQTWQLLAIHCPNLKQLTIGFEGGEESVYDSASFYSSQLTDLSLQIVAQCCPKLSKLELLRCDRVGDQGLMAVARNCRRMTSLKLHNCPQISERAIVLLAEKCTSLEHLDIVAASQDAAADLLAWPQAGGLGQWQLGFASLFTLAANCPRLKELSISEEQLVNPVIDDLGLCAVLEGCRELRKLSLAHVHAGDRVLHMLATKSKQLEELHLDQTFVTAEGLAGVLEGCQELRSLSVGARGSSSWPAPAGPPQGLCLPSQAPINNTLLASVAAHGKSLEELRISGACAVTDDGAHHLAATAPALLQRLRVLALDHTGLTACGVWDLLSHCRRLRTLSCAGLQGCCPGSDMGCSEGKAACSADAVMAWAARHCRDLSSVAAPYSCVTDAGLFHLGNCASLRRVDVSFCALITDRGLVALAAGLRTKLQMLQTFRVPTLSWAGVSRLVLLCPQLQHLSVGECAALQDFGLDRLLHAVLTDKRLAGLHVSLEEPHA